MKGFLAFFLILFFLNSNHLTAQNRADLSALSKKYVLAKTDSSRVLILSDWSRTIFNAKPDSSILLARHSLNLAKKINFPKGIARSMRNIAYCNIMNGKNDSALFLLKESLDLAKKVNDFYCIGLIHVNYANYYGQKGEYKRAISYLNQSILFFKRINNNVEVGKAYNNLGIMYKELGSYDQALHFYNMSAAICNETKDYNSLSIIYNNLGQLASAQGNTSKALNYYFSALKIFEQNVNNRILAITYNNIGDTYRYMKQPTKAIEYFIKCLNLSTENGQMSSMALANENLGLIYYESTPPNYEKALLFLNKSKELYLKALDINALTSVYSLLIEIYTAKKQFRDAEVMLNTAYQSAKNVESAETIAELHRAASEYYSAINNLSKSIEESRKGVESARKSNSISTLAANLKQYSLIAKKSGLYKEAYNTFSEYTLLNDSIQSQTEKKNLFLKEFQYKEAKLKLENLQKESEFKRVNNRRQWILFGGGLGLLFLLFHAFTINQNLQKQKKYNHDLNEINNTKDKLFTIISHDLRNPFSSILGLTEILKDHRVELDQKEINEITTTLHQSSKSAFELLTNLLDWAAVQTNRIEYNPQRINLRAFTEENIMLIGSLAERKKIQIINDTNETLFIFVDKNMLNTVLRNILTNAIKFTSSEGKIEIGNTVKQNILLLSVHDNGLGMTKLKLENLFNFSTIHSSKGTNNESGSGLGLILCKEFIEKNKGTLTVESEEGKGSNFIISIPLSV